MSASPAWGSGTGKRAPRAFGFEGQWVLIMEALQDWGKRETSILKEVHKNLMLIGTQSKSKNLIEA